MPNEYSNFTQPQSGYEDPDRVWDPVTGTWKRGNSQNAGNHSDVNLRPNLSGGTIDPKRWGGRGEDRDVDGNPIRGTSGLDKDVDRYRLLGSSGPASGPVIDRRRSDETRGISMGALGLLGDRATGRGVSAAQDLLGQRTDGAVSALRSGAASVTVRAARTRVLDEGRSVTQTHVRGCALSSSTAAVPRSAAAPSRVRWADRVHARRGWLGFAPSIWARARGIGPSASMAGRG